MALKDRYLFPFVNNCINSFVQAKHFSTQHAFSEYWQMLILQKNRPKIVFVTHYGAYQNICMRFGISSALASFQRALDVIRTKYKRETSFDYIHFITIYTKFIEHHTYHVAKTLICLKNAAITLKTFKFQFFAMKDKHLGHIMKPGRLIIDHAVAAYSQEALP